ncbi:MAG: cytochrome c family protein [Humidesulfovibrio sp.]|nr:cytochrome c family protein [Humidesulfovibrio sp.]
MMILISVLAGVIVSAGASISPRPAHAASAYVGSATCQGCHDKEYETFSKHSRKAHSDKSVKLMAKKPTAEELKGCYACHTTGYGQPGGFVSFEKTPDLGHLGCESCHGPGSAHVDSGGGKNNIVGKGRMNIAQCEKCHKNERVVNFRYKPRMYNGGH